MRSIQALLVRPGRIDAPTELAFESIHDGRTFASDTVTAWQGDRLCARFLVLLDRRRTRYAQTNMVRVFADPSLADGSQYRTVM